MIEVAIGLIYHQGKILVGRRDIHVHQGGCFEFPGGKVEANELPEEAVVRELKEEVGIIVERVQLFHQLNYSYPDRNLTLFFYYCHSCVSVGLTSKNWQWIALDKLTDFTFPSANKVIIERLSWERTIAISPDVRTLGALTHLHSQAALIYLRLPQLTVAEYLDYFAFLKTKQKKIIVRFNDYVDLSEQDKHGVFAIHLNQQQLKYLDKRNYPHVNFIAACHSLADIDAANQFRCDAILLSPVQETATHPTQQAMGWATFAEMTQRATMPVYALGGMQQQDIGQAQHYGAYGIAGIRDFWH